MADEKPTLVYIVVDDNDYYQDVNAAVFSSLPAAEDHREERRAQNPYDQCYIEVFAVDRPDLPHEIIL